MKSRSHHHRLQNSDPPDDWVNGSWTVDCVCGVNFDDGEEMVNCDECLVWVHTRCSRYVKGDDIFVCDKCKIKNNRNDSEETEVAQFLVELPTKTVRMESSYTGANGPPRRPPFRLWTDIPIEERVHVQGKPGGDPSMFAGLSSAFTPELWKCTGYVPKKFNFRYREFPCWDEKEEDNGKLDEENENPVDKGAGVLFSLSKESVVAAPMAGLAGLRGGEVEKAARDRRKLCLKERKKWDTEGSDARRMESCSKKENGLLRPVVVHSGKRKKEDLGMSKDRSGRKKARASEKDVDAKKRGMHSSKTVFTPTSDAKHLEFYEDRAPKFPKDEVQSMKNKNARETVANEPTSDSHLAGPCNVKNHLKETSSSDMAVEDCLAAGPKEDKVGPHQPEIPESSPKTNDAVCSMSDHDNAGKMDIKEEGGGMFVSRLDDSLDVVDKNVGSPHVKDISELVEGKESRIQDSIGELSVKSEQPNVEVKKENLDNNSGSLLNVQSSPHGDAKDPGMSSDHISDTPKLNGTTVTTSQSNDHKAEIPDQSLEAATDSHVNNADLWPDDLLESELEGTESLMALHKSPTEKHSSGLPEEHSKPGANSLNSHGLSSHRKMIVCTGKSSVSSTALIPKPSTLVNVKSTDSLNLKPIAKLQNTHDSNANVRKERALHDSRDENRDENPRRTMKERPKSVANPIPKPLNSSKISYDSLPKKTTAESKENLLSSSSKTHSAANITAVASGTAEHASLHHQKVTHTHNRSSTTGLSQKGEKPNQPNFQPPSKVYQNQTPLVCPSIPSSSPALSDEELALLLHQELNSSPRVPRVPRMRHAGNLPQVASPSATNMLMKRTSSSGGKDHSSVPRRKYRDVSKDGFRSSREAADEVKRMDRGSTSHDPKRRDTDYSIEVSTKREDNGSSAMESVKMNAPSATAATNSGLSSSNEANDRNLSSIRSSPRSTSDDDTGTVGGPVHRTLPGLINEIMSKGRRMTYEELCNAVLPHWHNLRKHNGERYAYTSHSQAVLDCLRNRNEWARLVDRGPKTNSSRKRRKLDADDSEDNDYGKGKASNQVESKSLESQKDDFPKGKRKARKRRRLALQGKGIKDIRKRRKQDRFTDEDFGTSSNTSEESLCSADDIQGGGGSEGSSSSDDDGETM